MLRIGARTRSRPPPYPPRRLLSSARVSMYSVMVAIRSTDDSLDAYCRKGGQFDCMCKWIASLCVIYLLVIVLSTSLSLSPSLSNMLYGNATKLVQDPTEMVRFGPRPFCYN